LTAVHARWAAALAVALPLQSSAVWAQPASSEFAVPKYVSLVDEAETDEGRDEEVDLANVVLTAARTVTTVQEAPAIITVIPDEEIHDLGFERLLDVVDLVPGWFSSGVFHSQLEMPIPRGTTQGMLYIRDGLSLFDPGVNVPQTWRIAPLETVKRVEMVTGPGGVLWGANSFLGIMSVTTKDAEDVDGVEVGVLGRDGNGDRGAFRSYIMVGIPKILSKKIKLFLHGSFETYQGPRMQLPQLYLTSVIPTPRGPSTYGPLATSDQSRSYLVNFDGKLTLGDVKLTWQVPWMKRYLPIDGFTGHILQEDLPEDSARDPDTGDLLCPDEPPFNDPTDNCFDKGREARIHSYYWYDRYVMGEYKRRLADGKFALSLKGYGVQFVREITPATGYTPHNILEGGANVFLSVGSYRGGSSLDLETRLADSLRFLFGGEAFYEWLPDATTGSRQGPGSEATWTGDNSRLPFYCPVRPNGMGGIEEIPNCPTTSVFESDRTNLAAYGDLQWKPIDDLSFDGGARVQVAPDSLGNLGYDPEILLGASTVWNFAPDWHLKLNYAEGFRAPVFNNTNANGGATNIVGNPEMEVERSNAVQAEVNARLFRGRGALRELVVRGDYSYTVLSDLIQVIQVHYENTGQRGIHSAEFAAKAYLSGGHRLDLSYTWLQVSDDRVGHFRALPEHWFHIASVLDIVEGRFAFWNRLRVTGSTEDPNQLVEFRDLAYDELGRPYNSVTGAMGPVSMESHDAVFDHLPASGRLATGFILWPMKNLEVQAAVNNAFNERAYHPDVNYALAPQLERLYAANYDYWLTLSAAYRY
jgi:outer membrane receptor protein involved in Fe transport